MLTQSNPLEHARKGSPEPLDTLHHCAMPVANRRMSDRGNSTWLHPVRFLAPGPLPSLATGHSRGTIVMGCFSSRGLPPFSVARFPYSRSFYPSWALKHGVQQSTRVLEVCSRVGRIRVEHGEFTSLSASRFTLLRAVRDSTSVRLFPRGPTRLEAGSKSVVKSSP